MTPPRIAGTHALFLGTFLAATGYGATFLLTRHLAAMGGGPADVGAILFAAMLGTFVGVPIVGWEAGRLGAANLSAAGAALIAVGFALLSSMAEPGLNGLAAGACIGIGWGAFFIAAPMSLSDLVTSEDRAWWFSRFAAFQMAGIGLGPFVGETLLERGVATGSIFGGVAVACSLSAIALVVFSVQAPVPSRRPGRKPWLRAGLKITASRSRFPIAMVLLGACAFSGAMTYQSALVAGTGLSAGAFFATYAIVVVGARFTLAGKVSRMPAAHSIPALLAIMVVGLACLYALPLGIVAQLAAAAAFGLGYGIVYPLIQAQAVNDMPDSTLHSAVMTWFILSYFVGIFGFPYLGGWIVEAFGSTALITTIVCAGLAELVLGILGTWRKATSVGT